MVTNIILTHKTHECPFFQEKLVLSYKILPEDKLTLLIVPYFLIFVKYYFAKILNFFNDQENFSHRPP